MLVVFKRTSNYIYNLQKTIITYSTSSSITVLNFCPQPNGLGSPIETIVPMTSEKKNILDMKNN